MSQSDVSLEVKLAASAVRTEGTVERFFCGVCKAVPLKALLRIKRNAAGGAGVAVLVHYLLVKANGSRVGEAFSAAKRLLLFHVDGGDVSLQIAFSIGEAITQFTLEPLSCGTVSSCDDLHCDWQKVVAAAALSHQCEW